MVVLHEMMLLRLPFPEAVAEEIVVAAAVDDGVVAMALRTDPMRIKQEQHRHFEIADRWDVLPLPDHHHHDCGNAAVKALRGDVVVVVAGATTKEAVGHLRLSKTMRVEDGPGIHLHLFLAILLLDDHLPY